MVFVAASHPGRIRRSRRIRQSCTMPDALRLSGLVLSLQCRENRPVFSACSPHAVSGLGF
ncbi:hypothetical protein ACN56_18025 [Escherichia coli]|nr:hypothetical protein ACN56_18025 [Escherichia coli]